MTGPIRRFDPSELRIDGESDLSTADQAAAMLSARELEAVTSDAGVRPSSGFEDRVMAVIATEPAPRLVVRPGSAGRLGVLAAFVATVRGAWTVATTGGRPAAVRAQAFALVVLVAVAVTAIAGLGAAGVGALLERDRSPAPSVRPAPTDEAPPSPTRSPAPSPSVEPSASPSPTETPDATETAEPTGTDDVETARPTRTPKPTETPEGSEDHSGPGGGSDDPGRGSDDSGSSGSGSGG
jgi:hypothetical protein